MKTLREQMIECKANGNLIECDISRSSYYFFADGLFLKQDITQRFKKADKILICVKHKCNCYSGACKEERGE